jgi:hypothetical protein
VSKVITALPLFAVGAVATEHADRVFVEIETEDERVLGSFRPKEYEALMAANIPNGGQLNWILEQMGVPYAPRPVVGSDASQVAMKKRKDEVSKKPIVKMAKVGLGQVMPSKIAVPPSKLGLSRKVSIVKAAQPKLKLGYV